MHDSELVKILCVDDVKNVLHALERFFPDDDYKIVITTFGEEGLRILEEQGPFRIVISDYRMPVMNGTEFLNRSRELAPDAMRILLTGYSDINATIEAINIGGAYHYITKPWNDIETRYNYSGIDWSCN